MYTQEVTINNEVGLHARPATYFIRKANEFKSGIWVEKDERRVNAKSLLGVLSLGIVKGTTITLIADGLGSAPLVERNPPVSRASSSSPTEILMWAVYKITSFFVIWAVAYTIVLLFVFPLVASVSNTNWAMLKNSFFIGTHYLFCTILVFAVHFPPPGRFSGRCSTAPWWTPQW